MYDSYPQWVRDKLNNAEELIADQDCPFCCSPGTLFLREDKHGNSPVLLDIDEETDSIQIATDCTGCYSVDGEPNAWI